MNIIIITAMYPPIKTGTSFYSKNIANALHNAGHNVTLLTVKNREMENDYEMYSVIRLDALHINLKNYFKHLRFVSFLPHNYYRTLKIVKENKIDAILLVNHYLDIAFPAIFASRFYNIPLVLSIGTQLQSLNPVRNKILKILDYLICGFLVLPFAKKIISWDREIERYINETHKNRFNKKTVIIPFGANGDVDKFLNYRNSYELKKQILGVGAVIGHRNYLFQVKVFKKLLDQFPDLKLVIIGHVYNDEAVKLVAEYGIDDRVVFMGEQPHDIVLSEMKKSDIHWMMLDGNYKGLGTSNLEAMMLGVPIISNIPEELFGKGSLVDMESFIHTDGISDDIIINKISLLLESENERKRIGSNGHNYVQQKMNWDIVAKEMEKVFISLKENDENK